MGGPSGPPVVRSAAASLIFATALRRTRVICRARAWKGGFRSYAGSVVAGAPPPELSRISVRGRDLGPEKGGESHRAHRSHGAADRDPQDHELMAPPAPLVRGRRLA